MTSSPTPQLLDYDIASARCRSPEAEWQPHQRQSPASFEWWYLTALLHDASGRSYFLLWMAVHFAGDRHLQAVRPMVGQPAADERLIMHVAALSNYAERTQLSYSEPIFIPLAELWDPHTGTLRANGRGLVNEWRFRDGAMSLHGRMPRFGVDLALTGTQQVMWPEDTLGTPGLIREGAEQDRSFYYSLPRLALGGRLATTDDSGRNHSVDVTGQGWVDRQWGDFLTCWWDWCSFRFDSGARLNFYNFQANDHQVVAYQRADGSVQRIDQVVVHQLGYTRTPRGVWVACGWRYEFPLEVEGSRVFRVEPFNPTDHARSGPIEFFEGAGRLIDETSGRQVGISVNESMDIRYLRNGPYDRQQP